MPRVFLDTTFCIDLLREQRFGKTGPARSKLQSLADHDLYLSVFVACELEAGARLAVNAKAEMQRMDALLQAIQVVYPTSGFAAAYADALAAIQKTGKPIPTMDLLIGVMALSNQRPLMTRDHGHFCRIPGLMLEAY